MRSLAAEHQPLSQLPLEPANSERRLYLRGVSVTLLSFSSKHTRRLQHHLACFQNVNKTTNHVACRLMHRRRLSDPKPSPALHSPHGLERSQTRLPRSSSGKPHHAATDGVWHLSYPCFAQSSRASPGQGVPWAFSIERFPRLHATILLHSVCQAAWSRLVLYLPRFLQNIFSSTSFFSLILSNC